MAPSSLFEDRIDAGDRLAKKLLRYASERPLILGIPRGGVPVALRVAERLNAPLDTVVVRKIGHPSNPEYGLGAIAPGDVFVFDNAALHSMGLTRRALDPVVAEELEEMDRRMVRYRSGEYSKDLEPGTAIIVDDGLATGVSARAAIGSVRLIHKPKRIVFAAPVCAKDSAEFLRREVDEVVCVSEVEDLDAVGRWYRRFPQTTDEEVLRCLAREPAPA